MTDERQANETAEGDSGSPLRQLRPGATGSPVAEGTFEGLSVQLLRLALSLAATFGYALLFGAAIGGVGTVLAAIQTSFSAPLTTRLLSFGFLSVPGATFLFVALYDDADLRMPTWTEDHPPLSDAWLLVLVAFGVVTVAFSTPEWPELVQPSGYVAGGVAAYVALPFWLARRCLRQPSWVLGGLAMLLAPLVLGVAAVSTLYFTENQPVVAAIAAVVGTVVPYGLAYASPGPQTLAEWAAEGLGRAGGRLRAVIGEVLGSGSE